MLSIRTGLFLPCALFLVFGSALPLLADSVRAAAALNDEVPPALITPFIKPSPSGPLTQNDTREGGIQWDRLFRQTWMLLSVEHAFRSATEGGTRDAFGTPFFRGYSNSVRNLHGWADGDEFYVNYVGHPMQGAIASYIWTQNDNAFADVEFGRSRRYWKAKLRGAGFSFLYSAQFEIGPVSEASIGQIQSSFPQQGFVDHVITPSVGMGWGIAEDAVDRYLVRRIEDRTTNQWIRLIARSGLNPARTMANVMGFKVPWYRDSRPGVRAYTSEVGAVLDSWNDRSNAGDVITPPPGVAPFEFTAMPRMARYGAGSCVGGGASGAFRLGTEWQVVVDVSGCRMTGLEENLSGDALTYLVGPRWTPRRSGRWATHAQVLIGGTKLTQERMYPARKAALQQIEEKTGKPAPVHDDYTQQWETDGFTIGAGTGLDLKLNSALAIRVASLGYSYSWTGKLNGNSYQNGVQFTSGLVLRMGTW